MASSCSHVLDSAAWHPGRPRAWGLWLALWPLLTWAEAPPQLSLMQGTHELHLSAAQLAQLPQHRIQTATPWTDGVRVFEGPLVRDVLALLPPAPVRSVTFVALDDYEVEVDVADFSAWDVIIARQADGQPLSRRDRGPLWVVYPRDQFEALQDSRVNHRWAWNLRSLRVNP